MTPHHNASPDPHHLAVDPVETDLVALDVFKADKAAFDIVEEILVKLCFSRDGYTVKEIPSTFGQRKSGKTKRDLRAFALSYVSTLRRLHALKRSVEKGRT